MKIGDKLLCKKSFKSFNGIFSIDKSYIISDINEYDKTVRLTDNDELKNHNSTWFRYDDKSTKLLNHFYTTIESNNIIRNKKLNSL
jgi:hypothetical protein